MSLERAASPSDVSGEEWALVAPYLALPRESSGQRDHELREVFNGLRYIVRTGAPWRFMPHDLPPWAAVYQQTQRWLSAECFADVAGAVTLARPVLLPYDRYLENQRPS
jgi:transposase